MWVRGLKHVDAGKPYRLQQVAPHVGAWIETGTGISEPSTDNTSHPMWVRGLKR